LLPAAGRRLGGRIARRAPAYYELSITILEETRKLGAVGAHQNWNFADFNAQLKLRFH
jgi:hypothetical protein